MASKIRTETLIVTTRNTLSGFCRIQGETKVYIRWKFGHAWERYRLRADGLEVYEGSVKVGDDAARLTGLMLDAPHD